MGDECFLTPWTLLILLGPVIVAISAISKAVWWALSPLAILCGSLHLASIEAEPTAQLSSAQHPCWLIIIWGYSIQYIGDYHGLSLEIHYGKSYWPPSIKGRQRVWTAQMKTQQHRVCFPEPAIFFSAPRSLNSVDERTVVGWDTKGCWTLTATCFTSAPKPSIQGCALRIYVLYVDCRL